MKKKTEFCIYDSSMVLSSTFNFESSELVVEFVGGSKYSYTNVEFVDYMAFSNGESIGKSFNEFIRKYEGTKIQENMESTWKE